MAGIVAYSSHFLSTPFLLKDPKPDYSVEYFYKKIGVFDQQTTNETKIFFNGQDKESYFHDEKNHRWGLIKPKQEKKRKALVEFDCEGHVVKEDISTPFSVYKNYDLLKKATIVALEAMGKNMKWEGESHLMAMSFMQHQLVQEKTSPGIEYHHDDSHYTMVVMLDDPQHQQQGWNGGELLFRPGKSHILVHRLTPEFGHGILFSNQGTQHAVTPFTAKDHSQDYIERTILTFHDYGLAEKTSEKIKLKSKWHYLPVCASNMASGLISAVSKVFGHIFHR